MSLLNRRLQKIEVVLNPPPPPSIILLQLPSTDELAEAKATGNRVIVVADVIKGYFEDGVDYMNGFEAILEIRASLPSKLGNRNALEDDINSIKYSTIEVQS